MVEQVQPRRNIANQQFGMLTAIEPVDRDTTGKIRWRCRCECGGEAVVSMLNIVNGTTKSCGCLRKRPSKRRLNLAGVRFGRLIAQSYAGEQRWNCQCDCGGSSSVFIGKLRSGKTKSCGRCVTVLNPDKAARAKARNETASWAFAVKAVRKCDACKSRGPLHAHHVMPFAQFPLLRTEIENGACLCIPCHKAVHKKINAGITPGQALADVIVDRLPSTHNVDEITNVIKYMARWRGKGGLQDLHKAAHYLEKLREVVGE
jgi:hypothetical protein